jgi:hydroxymethylbilane synthase
MPRALRVATRGSELALLQARSVAERLGEDCELVVVSTTGDRRSDVPIHTLGGTGVFVKEVQQAVLDGRADVAVHSAKDLTSSDTPGLVLASFPERADPRDALVGAALAELPVGARVASGSVRRRAQLAGLRPDLRFAELRGNIPTRVRQARAHDAVVVAAAALDRLGVAALDLTEADVHRLAPSEVLSQVGQGALAVECRAGDDDVQARLAAIDDRPTRTAVVAERAFLAELGGGCNLPCGALASVGPDGGLTIEVLLASLDGRVVLRTRRAAGPGEEPAAVGRAATADLLDACGGRALLEALG